MTYGGRLIAELSGVREYGFKQLSERAQVCLGEAIKLVPFALNEARANGRTEAENAFRVRLTGTEGMTSEGLALWAKVASEYMCYVVIGFTGQGWSCTITCPDTDVTRSIRHLDPESALRACVEKWAARLREKNPHLREPGVTIP